MWHTVSASIDNEWRHIGNLRLFFKCTLAMDPGHNGSAWKWLQVQTALNKSQKSDECTVVVNQYDALIGDGRAGEGYRRVKEVCTCARPDAPHI